MGNRWEENKELKQKQKELKGLLEVIKLHCTHPITSEQKQATTNWEERMEFRLNSLILESKLKELDIRIGVYKEVVKEVKKHL